MPQVPPADEVDHERLRYRPERFGAFLASESPPMLIAVDRRRARAFGIEGFELWDGPELGPDRVRWTAPIEVHVAVTDRCPVGCSGCYADATPRGYEPPRELIEARIDRLAEAGVLALTFGGGEAILRADLPELVAHARSRGFAPTVTTSGIGMTADLAHRLAGLAQINVSHDGVSGGHEAVRGEASVEMAERAIRILVDAGIPVGVNMVLHRRNFDFVEATAERVAALGAIELQLLRYKPGGRATVDYLVNRLDAAQRSAVRDLLRALVRRSRLAVRIDCSMVPFLADSGIDPADFALGGVLGCEAGRGLATLKSDGRVAGCSFASRASVTPVDRLVEAFESDESLAAFRTHSDDPPVPCSDCDLRAVCRGGCRVVADAVEGRRGAPDPECPRVIRWKAGA